MGDERTSRTKTKSTKKLWEEANRESMDGREGVRVRKGTRGKKRLKVELEALRQTLREFKRG